MTERSQIAAMVTRIDTARLEARVAHGGYTPRIRDLERRVDAATAEDFPAALAELERTWCLELARHKRLAAQGGTP